MRYMSKAIQEDDLWAIRAHITSNVDGEQERGSGVSLRLLAETIAKPPWLVVSRSQFRSERGLELVR